MSLILPSGYGKTDERITPIGLHNQHEFEDGDEETDRTFLRASQVVYHQIPQEISLDPFLKGEAAKRVLDQGVFKGVMGAWHFTLNWTTTWQGRIPPYHILIERNGAEVGVLSMYLTWRLCPNCKIAAIPEQPCRKCREKDWKARDVSPEDLERQAAEWLARDNDQDSLYDELQTAGVGKAK